MFLKIGDLKLLKIHVVKDNKVLFEGMVEDAPDEIKEANYKSATFESEYITIEI